MPDRIFQGQSKFVAASSRNPWNHLMTIICAAVPAGKLQDCETGGCCRGSHETASWTEHQQKLPLLVDPGGFPFLHASVMTKRTGTVYGLGEWTSARTE